DTGFITDYFRHNFEITTIRESPRTVVVEVDDTTENISEICQGDDVVDAVSHEEETEDGLLGDERSEALSEHRARAQTQVRQRHSTIEGFASKRGMTSVDESRFQSSTESLILDRESG